MNGDYFEDVAQVSQVMYLLDSTLQIFDEKNHTLRLSYKAILGFFPLHLRLIHKLIYLYGQFSIVLS